MYTIGIHAGNLYGAVVETAEWCSHTGGVMVNKYVVEDEKIKLSEIFQSNVFTILALHCNTLSVCQYHYEADLRM